MVTNKICLKCGSKSFVSDRSLGGRIVCIKCGSSSFSRNSSLLNRDKKILYFIIGFIVLLVIIIFF